MVDPARTRLVAGSACRPIFARYTVNELPQPQLALAFGLTKCSPLPISAES
jgi:hypothetical protein